MINQIHLLDLDSEHIFLLVMIMISYFLLYFKLSNMPDSSHCSVVGVVGIIVQVSLGVLSFSVLILKRHC